MSSKHRQKGFTLIELVVVIAILAILAAFALPRFAQLSEQAHQSSIKGTAGALSAGVALAKAQWVTNGAPGAVEIAGYGDFTAGSGVMANENGWPDPTQGDGCTVLWQKLLQSNAPTVAASGDNVDYLAAWDGATCTYTYQLDDRNSTIEYTPDTGEIVTTIN